MQNLGNLDNHYTLISLKFEDAYNFYYVGQNQNHNDFIIEIPRSEINNDNDDNNNIPTNDFNILNTLNNAIVLLF